MPQQIDPEVKLLFLSESFRPSVTIWNRLEGRPRTEDFARSLRAEVRDPLWMLCRQWQLGEFQGEDNGSATKAKAQITTAIINRYAGQNGQAVAYDDRLPLETRVERERLHFDLMTRAQMGRHWFKLLGPTSELRAAYLTEYGFEYPSAGGEEEARLRSDRKAWQTLEALKGRVVDGEKLIEAIRSGRHETWLAGVIADSAERQRIIKVAEQLGKWFDRVYDQPSELDNSAWADSYLEYQFACAAPADEAGEKQTVLIAEQYHHGNLDWYSFDIDAKTDARLIDREGAVIPAAALKLEEPISFIPNPIEFGGMPNVRWWEFEDRKTDFGKLRASTSDLATLMLAEFGLIYGNDWSLIPQVVKVGALCDVLGVVVTDVFGVRTLIKAASGALGTDRERWSIYNLNPDTSVGMGPAPTGIDRIDTRLFLPPATPKILEGRPIERVILARDEMANMVWGIEDIIPGLAGSGVDGYEAATKLESYLVAKAEPAETTGIIDTGAVIQYRLGTSVPENWIPFIPVHKPGSNREIRLQRARMPRLVPVIAENPDVEPRGAILRPGLEEEPPQPYFINEEEAAGTGAIVTRSYQRTRWWDGKIYTWLGRRKQTGRGQGSSGLEFDRIVPTEKDEL
jgi:hypothetical protein